MEMVIKALSDIMKKYHTVTCENFRDLNDDMDDLRGHMMQVEKELEELKALIKGAGK